MLVLRSLKTSGNTWDVCHIKVKDSKVVYSVLGSEVFEQ